MCFRMLVMVVQIVTDAYREWLVVFSKLPAEKVGVNRHFKPAEPHSPCKACLLYACRFSASVSFFINFFCSFWCRAVATTCQFKYVHIVLYDIVCKPIYFKFVSADWTVVITISVCTCTWIAHADVSFPSCLFFLFSDVLISVLFFCSGDQF